MKTLQNQTLIYDENCPLCNLYTAGFIKTGMLDGNGRKSYCQLSQEEQNLINIKQASNEIALIDNKNKTVLYGIDSLLKVVGFSFPWIEKIGKTKPINFILRKLYSFISYNRKVIMPNRINKEVKLQCIPDFNYKYRFVFIAFSLSITAYTLFNYSNIIPALPKSSIAREIVIAFSQIIFQSLFLIKLNRNTILNYVGNLMTVSLMGSLILMPIVLLNQFINLSETLILGWFAVTVLIMFAEHFRRIKLLELPFYLSYTWVLYRIITLFLILNL